MKIIERKNFILITHKRKYFVFDGITFNLLKISNKFYKQLRDNQIAEPYLNEWIEYTEYIEKVEKNIVNSYNQYFKKESRDGLIINITNNCNMRCVYCFADEGRYWEEIQNKGNQLNFAQLVKFIKRHYKRKDKINITYFGGEPLLEFKQIGYLQNELKKYYKEVQSGMTTNAVLLNNNEIVDFLKAENIHPLISFDGYDDVQNFQRPLKNKRHSFEIVIKGIKNYVNRTGRMVNIRSTVYPGKTDLIKLYKFFESLNFVNEVFLQFALPNNEIEENLFLSEIKGHKKNYADYFDFIQSKLLNNELIKDGKLIRDFGVIVNRQQKNRGCGAGSATVTVMNDGSVYPCYKINNNKYLMGNIFDKELSERQNYSIFEFENIKCRDCWARLICGGGCPGEGLFFKGDLEDKSEYVCQMEKCTIKGMLGIIIDTYVENYDKYLELFTNKKQEQQEQNPKEEEKNG